MSSSRCHLLYCWAAGSFCHLPEDGDLERERFRGGGEQEPCLSRSLSGLLWALLGDLDRKQQKEATKLDSDKSNLTILNMLPFPNGNRHTS